MKEIYIIGNGVIAKALAVALILNERKVTILRGSVDQQPDYTENIEVETENGLLQAEVRVSTLSNYETLDGIILLTNKSFGNAALAEKLKSKSNDSPIVFLQNGLHVEKCFIELGFPYLYRCVLFTTSQSVTKTRVRLKPVAASPVGIIKGSSAALEDMVAEISTTLFSFRAEEDIQTVIWKKVISNCVFNSICPLLEIDNGVFYRDAATLQLAETVMKECLAVANENGIKLSMDDVRQNVLLLSEGSDGQIISTYQDILNKRETEIETLNFAVAHAAREATLPVTLLLGQLVKIKADLHMGTT
jgi:2-dehydropantoate 2-reductase